MATEFGVLVKDMRIKKRLTLRKFCQELELDPSNWSKIERGINPPPRDETVLSGWADFFGLEGIFRQEFLDAGAIARQEKVRDVGINPLHGGAPMRRRVRKERDHFLLAGLRCNRGRTLPH